MSCPFTFKLKNFCFGLCLLGRTLLRVFQKTVASLVFSLRIFFVIALFGSFYLIIDFITLIFVNQRNKVNNQIKRGFTFTLTGHQIQL